MLMLSYAAGYTILMFGAWKARRPVTSDQFTLDVTGNLDAGV